MADDTDPAMLALARALATVLAPAAAPAAPAEAAAPAPAPAPTPTIPSAPTAALPPAVATLAAEQAASGIVPGNEVTREQLKGMTAQQIAKLPQEAVNAAVAERGA